MFYQTLLNFFFKYRPTLFTWKSVLCFYAIGGYMNITINNNGITQMAVRCSDGSALLKWRTIIISENQF